MPDVFISYSRRDLQFGKQLHQGFTHQGKDVWMDREDISLSADWWSEIKRGIDTSDNFLLIMSPDSIGSPVCQLEIEHACAMNKRIVPIFHRDPHKDEAFAGVAERIEADEYLKKMMGDRDALKLCEENWDVLGSLNRVFFKPEDNFDEKFRQLMATLEADLTHVRQHTRLQTRALEWQSHERSISFLVSGDELNAAEKWLADAVEKKPAPTPLHRSYIKESRRVERNRRRLVRLLTTISAVAGVLIVVALIAVVFSIDRANRAEGQANAAATQVMMASTAEQAAEDSASSAATQVAGATLTPVAPTLTAVAVRIATGERYAELLRLSGEASQLIQQRDGNPETAALLAIRALHIDYSPAADSALIQAIDFIRVGAILTGHTGDVTTAAYSPDGSTIASAGMDGTLRLWNATDGTPGQVFPAGDTPVNHLVYSPDGTTLALAREDGSIELYDAATGELSRRLDGHQDIVWWLVYNPAGTLLATTSNDTTARIWDAATGELLHELAVDSEVHSVDFSPDGAVLATGSKDGRIRLWDAATGDLQQTLEPAIEYGLIYSVRFHPGGRYLAAACGDLSVRLWDIVAEVELEVFAAHNGFVDAIDFTPDGRLMVTAGDDFNVILWELEDSYDATDESEATPLDLLQGHTNRVYDVRFSPDGNTILSASLDDTARLWPLEVSVSPRYIGPPVPGVAWSPDSQYTAAGTAAGTVYIRAAASGEVLQVLTGHTDRVEDVAFSPDSTLLASASDDTTLRLWEVTTGREVRVFTGHTGFVYSVSFSPDGTRLVSASEDGTVRVWDVATGQELLKLTGHTSAVYDADFSPDGQLIASGGDDYAILLWDAESGAQLKTLTGHTDFVNALEFSPDGQMLASASYDFTVRLWDIASGSTVRVLNGHRFWVLSTGFSPDGTRLVTGSADNSARIWDVAAGTTLRVLQAEQARISASIFSPDGRYVLTGDNRRAVRQWYVDYRDFVAYTCSRLLRDLTPQERAAYGLDDSPTCPE